MKIVVVGAGKVGYYLIKTLLDRGHLPSLIELDSRRCQVIAEETGILTVMGDGTDLAALVDAGADRADVIAAVTGMDEVNLVVCQLAKMRFGTKKAVARVSNPKNREVLQKLGVDLAVSGTALIADAIEEEILDRHLRTLTTLDHRRLSLVETAVFAGSFACGRAIRELAGELPPGCVLAAVARGEEVLVPRGGTVLAPGDTIISVVRRGEEDALRRIMQDKRHGFMGGH